MTPSFYSAAAQRLYPIRWWFLVLAVATMSAIFATATVFGPTGQVVFAWAVPLMGLPWALLCVCFWFHPEQGSMRPTSKLISWLPGILISGIRWYAALFITIFALFCVLFLPLLMLLAL